MAVASRVAFGIDTGGTFTDIIAIDQFGEIRVRKVDNLEKDPTGSIVRGVQSALSDIAATRPAQVDRIVHCTTLLGNSIIQRRGAVCGLITTRGFRDVLELRRQRNPVLYDVFWKKPEPLVPRHLICEITERIGADGSIVVPLLVEDVEHAIARLIAHGVDTVAICLLNSCVNPVHEQVIALELQRLAPELSISISSAVSPEWGEYERTSTTVTNAFIKPILRRYLDSMLQRLRAVPGVGSGAELLIMQSAGGVFGADTAIELPVQCLDSGPAATVIAAAQLGGILGYRNMVTLEIGGTTAKSSLIEHGQPRRVHETEIGTPVGSDGRSLRGGGYALRIPVIDAVEVGAGGGSIASLDSAGSLSVGPQGAGANPGPVCYGRGGTEPTVTDANLVLGFLSDQHLLGGSLRLDRELAEQAIQAKVAVPLGISTLDAAHAIRTLANAVLARAIRGVSTERGRDVRKFALLAAGGGGPGHAAEVARMLGIRTVVIPPLAGVFSALGLLWSPLEENCTQAVRVQLSGSDATRRISSAFEGLFEAIEHRLGATPKARYKCAVDAHYVGQFHELIIPVPLSPGESVDVARIVKGFEAEHKRTYGYVSDDETIEVAAVRVTVIRQAGASRRHAQEVLKELSVKSSSGELLPGSTRDIYFGPEFGTRTAQLLNRAMLDERPLKGPVILPEYDTTVTVPPDFSVRRESTGCLILENGASR